MKGKKKGPRLGSNIETVTFRIPIRLKVLLVRESSERGMTATSWLVRAIENEILRSEDVRAELDARLERA